MGGRYIPHEGLQKFRMVDKTPWGRYMREYMPQEGLQTPKSVLRRVDKASGGSLYTSGGSINTQESPGGSIRLQEGRYIPHEGLQTLRGFRRVDKAADGVLYASGGSTNTQEGR